MTQEELLALKPGDIIERYMVRDGMYQGGRSVEIMPKERQRYTVQEVKRGRWGNFHVNAKVVGSTKNRVLSRWEYYRYLSPEEIGGRPVYQTGRLNLADEV
jgi:hypothetical protein